MVDLKGHTLENSFLLYSLKGSYKKFPLVSLKDPGGQRLLSKVVHLKLTLTTRQQSDGPVIIHRYEGALSHLCSDELLKGGLVVLGWS